MIRSSFFRKQYTQQIECKQANGKFPKRKAAHEREAKHNRKSKPFYMNIDSCCENINLDPFKNSLAATAWKPQTDCRLQVKWQEKSTVLQEKAVITQTNHMVENTAPLCRL